MDVLNQLSIGEPPEFVNVVIEIPKGSANKYEVDKDSGLVSLDRVLYSSQVYPTDYGFLPQTHWHDGDPVDALVLSTHPFLPGVIVPARPIAVMRMVDDGDRDEKLICVPLKDPRFSEYQDVSGLSSHLQKELTNFFETYKMLQKKTVTVSGIEGHEAAAKVIAEAQQLYREQSGS